MYKVFEKRNDLHYENVFLMKLNDQFEMYLPSIIKLKCKSIYTSHFNYKTVMPPTCYVEFDRVEEMGNFITWYNVK